MDVAVVVVVLVVVVAVVVVAVMVHVIMEHRRPHSQMLVGTQSDDGNLHHHRHPLLLLRPQSV